MANIILVTGGTRSGKSDYAQQRAENMAGPHCFVATCNVSDPEMAERVRKHQAVREESQWVTLEEPLKIKEIILDNPDFSLYLVDCLTLWISNIMLELDGRGIDCTEEIIAARIEELLVELKVIAGTIIFVTNEVGMGIVPENRLARRYRDLVGRCNRIIASHADEVVFISCGLPLHLKKNKQ